jgi:hypothetical protein
MRNTTLLYISIFVASLLSVASIQMSDKCIVGMANCKSCTRFKLSPCNAGTKFEIIREDSGYGFENTGICTQCLPNTYQLQNDSCIGECFCNRVECINCTEIMQVRNNASPSFSKNNNMYVLVTSLVIDYYGI